MPAAGPGHCLMPMAPLHPQATCGQDNSPPLRLLTRCLEGTKRIGMKDLVTLQKTAGRGLGIFAIREIKKDEVITEFSGPVVTIPDLDLYPSEVVDHLFNIGTDRYIMAREPAVRTNHSCDPNAGIVRDVFLVAMRDIAAGEEVTFDYSTIIADAWVLECRCGSDRCRGTIGKYANLPEEVKQRYSGYTPEWIRSAI